MDNEKTNSINRLTDHFFRNEYGKMVAVLSKYVGLDTSEDIVQDTLLTAVEHWQHNGIPPKPEAWLYTTAKNKSLNWLRKNNSSREYIIQNQLNDLATLEFDEHIISDEQLRVMLSCCSDAISEEIQITLILKILCGFSIHEIAAAFYTSNETINKRLVRGRKALRENNLQLNPSIIDSKLNVLLKTIYLLFNEGYSPSKKNQIVRKDLCLEAIRLALIIVSNKKEIDNDKPHSLIALMCFNCSRFEARMERNETIEMSEQNRKLWDQDLINKGIFHLNKAQESGTASTFLILASISAQYCIAHDYDQTNWQEILELYNLLLEFEDSPITRLNRLVVYSKVYSPTKAIKEMLNLKGLQENHLYYSTLAVLYSEINDTKNASTNYERAISLATNNRDKEFLSKKLNALVPISNAQV